MMTVDGGDDGDDDDGDDEVVHHGGHHIVTPFGNMILHVSWHHRPGTNATLLQI